jgi:hypothetical protein
VEIAGKVACIVVAAAVVTLVWYEATARPGGPAEAVAMVAAVATVLTALAAVLGVLWRG